MKNNSTSEMLLDVISLLDSFDMSDPMDEKTFRALLNGVVLKVKVLENEVSKVKSQSK